MPGQGERQCEDWWGGTQRPLTTSSGSTQGLWLSRLELILLEIFQVPLFVPSCTWMSSEMPSALQEVPVEVTPSCSEKALPSSSSFCFLSFSLSFFSFFFFMDIKNLKAYLESRQLWAGVAG